MKIKLDTNKLSYSDWDHEHTGSTTNYTEYVLNGGKNYIIQDTDPFGNINYLWYANASGGTNMRCGWNNAAATCPITTIDMNKNYRISCWVKIKTLASTSQFYFGQHALSGRTAIGVNDLSGVGQLYWASFSNAVLPTYFTVGEWRLLVAHFRNVNWTGTTNSSETGIWSGTTNIDSIPIVNDRKFISGNTTNNFSFRLLFLYNETGGGTGELCYPRIDLVDGTEPSITTLLNNEGPWRSVVSEKIKVDQNLLSYDDWNQPITGSTYSFLEYVSSGGVNNILQDTDPFGNTTYLWYANASGGTNKRCGWNNSQASSPLISIDITKNYRISCWIRQKTLNDSGGLYLGQIASSGRTAIGVNDLDDAGQVYWLSCANSYLKTYFPVGEWKLVVCHFKNVDWTGTTTNTETGIWSGTTMLTGITLTDRKFITGTDNFTFKILYPYNETGGGIGEMCYPRIDLVDGTEPSITTLLAGEGPWRNVNATKINIGDVWKDTT